MISLTERLLKTNDVMRQLWKSRKAYALLIPIFICLGFNYYPPLLGMFRSLYEWRAGAASTFVGLDNYIELFHDRVFIDSLWTLVLLTVPRLAISIIVPFIVAEMIFAVRNEKLKYVYRVLIVLPIVAPGVVTTFIWRFIFDPINGLMVYLCRLLGIIGPTESINWLGNPDLVIPSIVFMGFPWVAGTAVLIYLSGLIGISKSVIEASILDGCGTIRRIIRIDLPLVMGQVRFFLITGLIALIQDYGVQLLLTKGGPGYTTYVPGWHLYVQAFTAGRMGYASAIGVFLFVVIMTLSVMIMKTLRSKEA